MLKIVTLGIVYRIINYGNDFATPLSPIQTLLQTLDSFYFRLKFEKRPKNVRKVGRLFWSFRRSAKHRKCYARPVGKIFDLYDVNKLFICIWNWISGRFSRQRQGQCTTFARRWRFDAKSPWNAFLLFTRFLSAVLGRYHKRSPSESQICMLPKRRFYLESSRKTRFVWTLLGFRNVFFLYCSISSLISSADPEILQ